LFTDADLRKLAEMAAQERVFLSVFLAGPHSVSELEAGFRRVRHALKGEDAVKDERDHFDENVEAVWEYLEKEPIKSGSLCMFSCRINDFFLAVPLNAPVNDLVWIDSSPYIRPLAEFLEEYENVAVVIADNKRARIFLVTSAVAGEEELVKGNVKNHVKKGGWSQQRYERRRDKQLLSYAREIVDALSRLEKEEEFKRILLVGGREILRAVYENLPQAMQKMVSEKAVDLRREKGELNKDIMDLFNEQERRSERDRWEQIRTEYLRGGLGVVGLEQVLWAARASRVESMVVSRTFKPEGRRCRGCDNLEVAAVEECPACGSSSLYAVDVVNEIIEMLKLSGAEVDFVDPIQTLAEVGDVAALLRY
jgi:peptide chain release factor subunit 1